MPNSPASEQQVQPATPSTPTGGDGGAAGTASNGTANGTADGGAGAGGAPGGATETPYGSGGVNAPGSGSGGTGGGGGYGPLPSIEEMITDAIVHIANEIAGGVGGLVDGLNAVVFGVPAPGDPGDVSTWANPQGELWGAAWSTYWDVAPLALLVLVFFAMRAHANYPGRDLKAKYAEITGSAVMILGGWWVIAAALHLANAITMVFAPSGAEFLATPGSAGKLASGGIFGAGLLVTQSGIVFAGAGITYAEQVILVGLVAISALIWPLRIGDSDFSTAAAGMALAGIIGIVGARGLRAVIARFLFNMEWSASAPGQTGEALLVTIVGLLLIFVAIPLQVKTNFIPETVSMLGRPAVSVADGQSARVREGARQRSQAAAKQYANSARGSVSAAAQRVPSPSSVRQSWGARADGGQPSSPSSSSSSPTLNSNRPSVPPAKRDTPVDAAPPKPPSPDSATIRRREQQRIDDRLRDRGRY